MAPGFSMQYPAEFSRMHEANPHLRMNEKWAIEQQQQMRAYEETTAKAAWAAEFGSAPQSGSSASVLHTNSPAISECMSLLNTISDTPTNHD